MGHARKGERAREITVGELVSIRLREHVGEFLDRVVDDAPAVTVDDVHQARVALRRLRSDLRLFAPFLDAEVIGPLRDEIAWFAGELGELRDLDVMAEVVMSLAGSARVDPAPVVAELARRRVDAEKRLAPILVGRRSMRLRRGLVAVAADPPLVGRVDRAADDVLVDQVRRAWRRLERAVDVAGSGAGADAVHKVRIRAKRVRYASETVACMRNGRPPKLAARLAALQEHLGDFHDRVVVARWLRDFGRAATPSSTAFAAGALAVVAERDAERLAAGWQPLWERAAAARPHRGRG